MKAVKKAASILLSVILWGIILLAALFAFTTLATRDQNKVANIAGFTPLSVMTDSMAPTFRSGDLIIIRTCDPASLQVGDIITFHTIINNEYALNTHRIQTIDTSAGVRSYVTIGDNNNGVADTHIISDGDIVGKYVTRLAGVGKVLDFLSSSTGFLVVIVLPMLLFFIYQVYHLIMVSIELKKASAQETARELAGQAGQAPAQGSPVPPQAPAAPEAETPSPEAGPLPDDLAALKAEAERAKAEAKAALAEAKRLKAEAEALNRGRED